MQNKTSGSQKLFLFLFGLCLTVLLLEAGLRFCGWAFLSLQDKANRHAIGRQDELRVLCLGESTTALGGPDAYPRQLERILNSRQDQITFKVINKGVPATTTEQIVSRVESYLRDYQPHIVVAMMGINDPPDEQRVARIDVLAQKFRVVRLGRMIQQHFSAKARQAADSQLLVQLSKISRQVDANPSAAQYVQLASLYRAANHPELEKAAIDKALVLSPLDHRAHFLLGIYHERRADNALAVEAFKTAFAHAPPQEREAVFIKLVENYKLLGQYDQARRMYEELLSRSPRHPRVHAALADIYFEQGQYELASKHYQEQVKIDPDVDNVHERLAFCYRQAGQAGLAQQTEALAGHSHDKALDGQSLMTRRNYAKLHQLLRQQKIPLVAVQYPLRPLAALTQMTEGLDGIIYVDNQKIFQDALSRGDFDEYFSDRFAGDFGHCTHKGNELLAGHIADIILKRFIR